MRVKQRGYCSVGSANDQVVHMVINYVAFPSVDDVGNRFAIIRLVLVQGSYSVDRDCVFAANGSTSSNVVVPGMGPCTSE